MRVLYLFTCLTVTSVMARPEPPVFIGLPQQNQIALPLNAPAVKQHTYQQLPQEHSFSNFVASPVNYGSSANPPTTDNFALATTETNIGTMSQEDSYNAAYRHSSSQQYHSGYASGPTETQVHKHIYVHVPPKDFEEEDAIQPHVTHQVGSKQKHYNIIFIRAPMSPAISSPIVPPLPQKEEKTLIYVLHKKPDTLNNIVIPTPEPTKPSKPEVFFIKYNTKRKEAPVYGPPPGINEFKSRQAAENEDINFKPMDFSQYQMVATTQQPTYQEDEHQPQLFKEENSVIGAELYNMTNFISEEEFKSTTVEPNNEHLAPEMTLAPIVVKEMQEPILVPASSYGTPNRSHFLY